MFAEVARSSRHQIRYICRRPKRCFFRSVLIANNTSVHQTRRTQPHANTQKHETQTHTSCAQHTLPWTFAHGSVADDHKSLAEYSPSNVNAACSSRPYACDDAVFVCNTQSPQPSSTSDSSPQPENTGELCWHAGHMLDKYNMLYVAIMCVCFFFFRHHSAVAPRNRQRLYGTNISCLKWLCTLLKIDK